MAISTTKLTARSIVRLGLKGIAYIKRKSQEAAMKNEKPTGKQTIQELIGQNQGVTNIDISKTDLKGFEKYARKYGVDYAITKSVATPPLYMRDIIDRAITVCTAQSAKVYNSRGAYSKKPGSQQLSYVFPIASIDAVGAGLTRANPQITDGEATCDIHTLLSKDQEYLDYDQRHFEKVKQMQEDGDSAEKIRKNTRSREHGFLMLYPIGNVGPITEEMDRNNSKTPFAVAVVFPDRKGKGNIKSYHVNDIAVENKSIDPSQHNDTSVRSSVRTTEGLDSHGSGSSQTPECIPGRSEHLPVPRGVEDKCGDNILLRLSP